MTPLDTNSMLTLRKLSDAATTGTEENDRYVMDSLSVAPPAYMDDEDRAWRDFVAALLPTTISALCRLALEGVAMKEAMREEFQNPNDATPRFIERRTAEILAALEKETP